MKYFSTYSPTLAPKMACKEHLPTWSIWEGENMREHERTWANMRESSEIVQRVHACEPLSRCNASVWLIHVPALSLGLQIACTEARFASGFVWQWGTPKGMIRMPWGQSLERCHKLAENRNSSDTPKSHIITWLSHVTTLILPWYPYLSSQSPTWECSWGYLLTDMTII